VGSFKTFLLEAKATVIKYSDKIKDFDSLLDYLNAWKLEDYTFDKIDDVTIEVYFADVDFLGNIKDKKEGFALTGKLKDEEAIIDHVKL